MTTRWPSLTSRTAASTIRERVGSCVLRDFSFTIELVPKDGLCQPLRPLHTMATPTQFDNDGEMPAFHAYL